MLPHVLFVCTGNAGRSQIAQAFARRRLGDRARIESAGVAPWTHLHPVAASLLKQRGLLCDDQRPKSAESVEQGSFDLVVTIGDPARARLPERLRRARRWIHWDLPDPADADGKPESETVFQACMAWLEERCDELVTAIQRMSPAPTEWRMGINTGLWWPGTFNPGVHLAEARRAGFEAIELNCFLRDHFNADNPAGLQDLRRAISDLGMTVAAVHAPDGGGLASDSSDDRRRQMDILLHYIELAESLGSETMVTHALFMGPFADDLGVCESRFETAIENLQPRLERSPVRIGFENGFMCKPGRWAADVLRRLGPASGAAFGFTLDPGHSNIAHDLPVIAAGVGSRLLSLHLNDNDGKHDRHLVPGQGTTDWPSVAELLRRCAFQGPIMYELLGGIEQTPNILAQATAWHGWLVNQLTESTN